MTDCQETGISSVLNTRIQDYIFNDKLDHTFSSLAMTESSSFLFMSSYSSTITIINIYSSIITSTTMCTSKVTKQDIVLVLAVRVSVSVCKMTEKLLITN